MKRILSVLLTVALLFSSIPMVIMADTPNDFQANFNVDALDEKWNTKEDGSGDTCDTVRLDFQVKGTNLSRNQGAWVAIDLTQLVWVDYTEDGYTIFDAEDITIVPGATAVKFFEGDEPYYYDLKDPVKSGRNTVDMWNIGDTAPILVAVSADNKTMYLCPQPSQSYEVTYETLTTIVSFRLAVHPGVELTSDAVRLINAEERAYLNQSFIVLMADATNSFGYGFAPDKVTGVAPADTLVIPDAFTGTAGITGQPTVEPVDAVKPVIDVDPAGASYIVGTAATPLTVSATVTDGGTLTYEWFKNDTNSNENGTSVGTGAAYTPATDVIGETYYYVVVTNTNETATGAKTATTTSAAAKITVTADPDLEALAAAKQTLETTGIGSVNQKECPSEDDIKAYIVSQLRGLVPGFELTVNTVKYTPSVPGTSAAPMGTNGEYQYTVTIAKNGKTTTTAALKADVLAVVYEGITDEQAIAAAESALKAITWSEIAQATANTKDAVQAKLLEQAKAAVNNANVTVTVDVTAFTAAVKGTAATTKEGTNGSATFTVTATIGSEEYKLENQSVVIKATEFDGKLDVEVIAEAEAALKAAAWSEIAQATANTKDAVQAKLLEQAKAAVNNANVTVTVEVTAFTAAVAGSAATTKEGTNGSATFTVTATIGSEEYKQENQSVVIKATAFDGKLDSEVIAEAEAALKAITWAEIAQAVANTQDTVQAKLLEQAKAAINNDRVTVTVEVTAFTAAVAGSAATTKEGTNGSATFTVTATIGSEEYKLEDQSVVIKATEFDGKLDVEVIAEAEAALKAAAWSEIAQATANTKDAVQAKLLEQAKAAINNDRVTVTVEVTAFTAAVAGSAATTKEGTNGSATFTVTATIGSEEYKLENQSVVIKATRFTGVLDVDAVEAAKKALVDSKVIVKIGATESEIRTAVENYLKALMKGDAKGVTLAITAVDGAKYTVSVAKGNVTAEKTITITVEEEDPIKLSEPANLQFINGVASWTSVENAVSYTVSLYEVVDGVETLITAVAALNNQCDFSEILEEGKSYVFDVIAHGDGVYFLDSDVSDFSAVYTEGNTWEQILVVLLAIRNSKYSITATAGEGGAITDAGITKVKYGRDMTYYIAAEPGYEIDHVIVDGKDVGAVSEYTFTDVKKKHTISVTFKAVEWENPFKDVSETDPFCDAVQFVYENKLFQGISDTEFAPSMTMTRAMFVTVLWRLEGMPVVNYLMRYEDVEADTWYTEAIRWATAEGIVEGYGDGIFGTNDPVTVQQSAVIMARYAEYTGNYTAPGANLGIYADHADVADWALEAMMWAVENGVYAPVNGKLVPTALAPRSLAAQLMHAYVVKFGK